MKKNVVTMWSDPKFKKFLKKKAIDNNTTLLGYQRKIVKENIDIESLFFNKKTKRTNNNKNDFLI